MVYNKCYTNFRMTSHRSRNLVKLCLEPRKQDAETEQNEYQAAQDSIVLPPTAPQIPVQIEFIDQFNISSDSMQIFNIENSVIDNISLSNSSEIHHRNLEVEILESSLESISKPTEIPSAIDTSLIQPTDLGFDNQSLQLTLQQNAHSGVDMSAKEDSGSEYLAPESDSSSSDSSLSDVENTINELQSNSEVFHGDMSEGRRRRKKADPEQWKKNLNKRLRMEGKAYLGYDAPKGEKIQHNKNRPERSMGPPCTSDFCKKSAVRRCDEFTENNRNHIFESFWKTMDWSQRKIYVGNNVTVVGKKRVTTSGPSRRGGTLKYYLPLTREDNTSERIPVCRKMFVNTLCLGTFTVQSWAKKSRSGILPSRENECRARNITPRRTAQDVIINEFFDSIPKLPSHYNRKDTSKLFIEPIFRNKSHLYQVYKQFCNGKNSQPFSIKKFDVVFSNKNIAIHQLKKDMCDTCMTYQIGNLSEHDYQQHISRKNTARQEKEKDKKDALEHKYIVLNVDLQAVKVCPFLTASAVYYKTKLALHNYSVYNVTTHHATCYWFAETEADLSSSTFATMLIDYLEKHCRSENIPIIIYSDGCAAQNRNNVLANALLNFSIRHNVNVYQKFLEVGHTQMEGDSVHSCIERKLKNRIINLPSDYVTATKEARIKPFPYETCMLHYNFFLNYADPQLWRYSSIRPGRKAGDPKVTDIKAIAYLPDGLIRVKLDYNSEWMELPQRPKRLPVIEHYESLHTKQLPIHESKFKHLQELKTLLPADCQSFYDSLPYI